MYEPVKLIHQRHETEWHKVKRPDEDFGMDGVLPPTAELVSVEECSQPESSIRLRFATMRLVRVERCFQSVFKGTSLHGGELRGGVVASLGRILVMNIARRGQAPPWREMVHIVLNLVPFGTRPLGLKLEYKGTVQLRDPFWHWNCVSVAQNENGRRGRIKSRDHSCRSVQDQHRAICHVCAKFSQSGEMAGEMQ